MSNWPEVAKDIGLVLLLIGIGSLFVVAEIALITLRESQIKQIATRGKRGAKVAALTKNPNRFLAAAQVGVTVCGFLSAAVGAEKLGRYLIPKFEELGWSNDVSSNVSLILLTLVIAYVSLVIGELVPKRLALYKAETISLYSAGTIDKIAKFLRPIIWLLSKSTDLIIRLFGVSEKSKRSEVSEAEILDLVSGHSQLSEEERDIVEEVFNAGDLSVKEVMVPRTEVDFLDSGLSINEARELAVKLGHSRFPVIRGTSDEVIGFIHVRDLINPSLDGSSDSILELVRNVLFLPGSKGVLPALTEMRAKRQHIAIVLDEYGGTDGIVTLENLVESFIGEIHDEYDLPTDTANGDVANELSKTNGEIFADGLISISDLAESSNIVVPEGPYETLSGFLMHYLGRIPKTQDIVRLNGIRFTVVDMVGKRVGQVRIIQESNSRK
jgi:putative hemolysin